MINLITELTITKSILKQNVDLTQEDMIEKIRQYFPAAEVNSAVATIQAKFVQEANNTMKRHLELVQCVKVQVTKKTEKNISSVNFNNKLYRTDFKKENDYKKQLLSATSSNTSLIIDDGHKQ